MKYVHKPIVIEAIQWTGLNLKEVTDFIGENSCITIHDVAWKAGVTAPVAEIIVLNNGTETHVNKGDFIIKNSDNTFSVCPADIFNKTYDLVYTPDEIDTFEGFKVPNTCGECNFIGVYEDGPFHRNPHCCCELLWLLEQEEYRVNKNSLDPNCPLTKITE